MPAARKPPRLPGKLGIPKGILERAKPAAREAPVAAIGEYTGLLNIRPRSPAALKLSEDLWKWVRGYLHRRTHQVSHPSIAEEIFLLDKLVKEMKVSIERRNLRDKTDWVLSSAIRLLRNRVVELKGTARAGPRRDTALAQALPAFAECCWRHNPRATDDQILALAAAVLVIMGIKRESATSATQLRALIWPSASEADRALLNEFTVDWLTLKKRTVR